MFGARGEYYNGRCILRRPPPKIYSVKAKKRANGDTFIEADKNNFDNFMTLAIRGSKSYKNELKFGGYTFVRVTNPVQFLSENQLVDNQAPAPKKVLSSQNCAPKKKKKMNIQ